MFNVLYGFQSNTQVFNPSPHFFVHGEVQWSCFTVLNVPVREEHALIQHSWLQNTSFSSSRCVLYKWYLVYLIIIN